MTKIIKRQFGKKSKTETIIQ